MDSEVIENALEKKCRKGIWLYWIFFLTSSPGILSSMHIISYVFLAKDLPYRCEIPELTIANWTDEQIKNITMPSFDEVHSCSMYQWNYTNLREIGYDSALNFSKTAQKPETVNCQQYHYYEDSPKSSIISQWDLVCDRLPLRSTVQLALAFGKFLGAFTFGIMSDKIGRKKVFCFGCLLYMTTGPVTAYVDSYMYFISLKFLMGSATAAIYETGYAILTELTVKKYRAYSGTLFNISYSIGLMLLPVAAYYTDSWRNLQLAISVPTVLLLLHMWCLPESPRWLIIHGKFKRANVIIGSSSLKVKKDEHDKRKKKQEEGRCDMCKSKEELEIESTWYEECFTFLDHFLILFSTAENAKKTLIVYFSFSVVSLCYFTLALNGNNFTINQYIYIGLNGLFEALSYFLPLFLLTYFGRRTTSIGLYGLAGTSLLSVVVLPKGLPVLGMALFGRFLVAALFAVVLLHTSELFPVVYRNTALGTSLTMGQIGTMAAPYIVDILGEKIWYIPSTICGISALLAACFVFFLPETKDETMQDHVQNKEELLAEEARNQCTTCFIDE